MTKQPITKILFTILISMMGLKVFAYDIKVENADGVTIYYNYINDGKELEVTYSFLANMTPYGYSDYVGDITIPEEVSYMNRIRKVTSIGENAFYGREKLTSLIIPNSVTSIGDNAFWQCKGLSSMIIPNSVIYIGWCCFYQCTQLTSVSIGNSVTSIGSSAFQGCNSLTSIVIPNSVVSMGSGTFSNCTGLESVIIGNSVSYIGSYAFNECSKLTYVNIPNSVISIEAGAFDHCIRLSSVTIGNSVTSIEDKTFQYCKSLISVTIPNSVTSIGERAFYNCTSLTSVTIPNTVTHIGNAAFEYSDIPTIISLIDNPFIINSNTFSISTFNNATLYVPKGTIEKYKSTEGWKEFDYIEEGTGPDDKTSESQKCATPTICYTNGKLTFNCETEGVTYQYSITDYDIKSGIGNEVQLGVTYLIRAYATKFGYENSEVANATLCWIDVEPKTEGVTNNVAQIQAKAVVIQTANGCVNVNGLNDGAKVSVYDIRGAEVGSAVSYSGNVNINTILVPGSIAIVKFGEKSIKVPMK